MPAAYSSEFIAVNGTTLHFLRWRSLAPPLLIVHGNTHCGGVYAPLAERLAADFDVIALDLRGHGLSDRPATYSWCDFRADLVEMIEKLDLRDLLLVCHSRGGGICLLAASALPARVRGVVAYEPTTPLQMAAQPGASPQALRERARGLMQRAASRRSTFASREEMYRHFQGRGAFAGWRDEYLRAFVEHGAVEREGGGVELASPVAVEGALYQAMVELGPWSRLGECPVPVLAVFGELSGRLTPGQDPVAVLRPLFPRIGVRVLPGCTHSGPMERPDLFEETIRAFVASLATPEGIQ